MTLHPCCRILSPSQVLSSGISPLPSFLLCLCGLFPFVFLVPLDLALLLHVFVNLFVAFALIVTIVSLFTFASLIEGRSAQDLPKQLPEKTRRSMINKSGSLVAMSLNVSKEWGKPCSTRWALFFRGEHERKRAQSRSPKVVIWFLNRNEITNLAGLHKRLFYPFLYQLTSLNTPHEYPRTWNMTISDPWHAPQSISEWILVHVSSAIGFLGNPSNFNFRSLQVITSPSPCFLQLKLTATLRPFIDWKHPWVTCPLHRPSDVDIRTCPCNPTLTNTALLCLWRFAFRSQIVMAFREMPTLQWSVKFIPPSATRNRLGNHVSTSPQCPWASL